MRFDRYWLLLSLAGVAAQAGSISYRITDLGTLGATASANAINASGQTAGTRTTVYGDMRAYGPAGDITPSGAADSMAAGINSFGHVTGTSYVAGTPYATVWSGGSALYLTAGSYGMALNDAGQVTGATADGHAFVSSGDGMTDLGTLAGGSWTSGYAINQAGQVAGYGDTGSGAFRAFVFTENGGVTQLGTLGGMNSYAFAINNAGRVAGSAQKASGYMHAYVTAMGGGLIDLGTLGGGSSHGYGINSTGSVVGYSSTADGESRAFLYQSGGMIDLNSILLGNTGWVLTAAYGINDKGQIAGSGIVGGVEHAFRLDPVVAAVSPQLMIAPLTSKAATPEPGSIGLLAIGASLIAIARSPRFRVHTRGPSHVIRL